MCMHHDVGHRPEVPFGAHITTAPSASEPPPSL
jgi:hypothetical protein